MKININMRDDSANSHVGGSVILQNTIDYKKMYIRFDDSEREISVDFDEIVEAISLFERLRKQLT